MKEMRDGCNKCGGPHLSSDWDDKPMGGPKEEEANYASGGYRGGYQGNYYGQNSSNWRDRQSYHRDENRNSNPGEENPPIPCLPEKKPDESEFEKTMREFVIAQKTANDFVKNQFYNLKTKVEQGQKNHQVAIQDLETKFGRISDHQFSRPTLPNNTQTKPKPSTSNERPYRPPPARNEHVNAVFTCSGKTYGPPANPNTKTAVFLDNSEDEAEEVEKETEPLPKKPTQTDTPPLKAYKQKIPYPQRLNKEKIEARYAKFLDMIKEVRINVPLVDVLAGMPNYGKFLKDLVSNKSKMEQISVAFLTEKCSAILQNKITPKLGDPKSFLIPCKLANSVEYLALADLGANFIILQMEEVDRVPLILGRPFLHTADAIIRVKKKELNLGIGEDRATFHIDKAMHHSHVNDDTCFCIDVIDEITEDELDALLDDSKPFLNTSEKISETSLNKEFNEFMSLSIIQFVSSNQESTTLFNKKKFHRRILQNKLPPKLEDPRSFLVPCKLANSVEYLALADLGTSINLMLYSLYAALSGTTLKPTRISIRLANHTYQYPMGVTENMLVQVGKFMFSVDFVILQMEEDNKVTLILGRPFLHTADAIIRVKNKELNLGIGEDRATFLINKAMQHSHLNDDTCFRMDVIDEVTEDELDALLDDSKPFLSTSEKIRETPLNKEFDEFMSGNVQEDEVKDDFEELPPKDELRIKTSIQDPPTDLEMKPLSKHLEYAFLEENSLLPVVISALLKQNEKERLVLVLKNHKEAFAWKTSDILWISLSFCKHKINFKDDVKPVIQRQHRVNPNMKEVVMKEIIKLLDVGIIYVIEDSPWVSPVHCIPKKGGMTVVTNEDNELVPTRTITG
ncbi:reverse transcriptase domain-containing protein [Tanacetum coccineum]|uniref:Reverse transcriptase domain-containing protein n=1 Tax=Tanacetum coccineum TaxID=301880 RepID=A0ABQ5INL2_9ASTR